MFYMFPILMFDHKIQDIPTYLIFRHPNMILLILSPGNAPYVLKSPIDQQLCQVSPGRSDSFGRHGAPEKLTGTCFHSG